jgi:putative spermidine/putrescine transport system ATP-binding protein
VITVTHDQVEAMSLADRIAVMKDGALQQIDTPQAMYAKPTTKFIARFVGESSFLRTDDGELALRPEVLKLSAKAGGGLACTVTGVIYFGPVWRITVELADGQSLVVSVPGVLQPFAVGDSAYVSWAAQDAVDIAASDPHSTKKLKE